MTALTDDGRAKNAKHLIKEAEANINKSIARRASTKKNIEATRTEIAKIKSGQKEGGRK